MRLLQGTKVVDAPAGWREALVASGRGVVVDVGAGDGRFVYESARRDAKRFYIAIDPDATALGEYAFRAARKPARGGIANAAFVVAAVEQLPPELLALAGLVRVNFPWGSLLRGLLEPQPATLSAVASLALPDGAFEFVLSYDPTQDTGAFAGERLPAPDEPYIDQRLIPAYATAGLDVEEQRRLGREEALAIPSTWGRRLLHGRRRDVFLVRGSVSRPPRSANLTGS